MSTPVVIMCGVCAAAFAAFVVLHRRKTRKAAAVWAKRATTSDADFLDACGIAPDPFPIRVALAARKAIAKLATVPTATILPDDSFAKDLVQLPFWDSLDWISLALEMEKDLGDVWVEFDGVEKEIRSIGWNSLLVRHVVKALSLAAKPDPNAAKSR